MFLCGFPGTWDQLGLLYELLEPHFHLFAPTMRGMGLSQRVDSYPIPPYIDDAGKFIRAATMIAVTEAMRNASDVDGLASLLAEVPASGGGTLGDQLSDEELAAEADELSSYDPEIFGPWADHGLESWIVIPELDAWPGAYRGPVLFIDGDPEAGPMISPSAVDYNVGRYPTAERIEMTGYDHLLELQEDPEPVVSHIRSFFDKGSGFG